MGYRTMTNKMFLKVVELDEMMNEAIKNGDTEAEQKYYEEQEEIVATIEKLGLRKAFDEYIKSIS